MGIEAAVSDAMSPVGVEGIIKALASLRQKGLDDEACCKMMRGWAYGRKVTAQKKVITPEDTEAAIAQWLPSVSPETVTPALSPAPNVPKDEAKLTSVASDLPTNTAADTSEGEMKASADGGTKAVTAPPAATSKKKRAAATEAPPKEDRATKKQRLKEEKEKLAAERKEKERLEELERQARCEKYEGLSIEEKREKRLAEVIDEIDSNMLNIARRMAQTLGIDPPTEEALAPLRGKNSGDAREAFIRLVHTIRVDPSVPEGLNAELMAYQVEGLEWLASICANGLHGLLADEMGLGKTIQTIALLVHLKETKGDRGPHLIVAPKSTLTNWSNEFQKFAPDYKHWIFQGEIDEREVLCEKFRKRVKHNKTTVCITNFEQMYRNDWLQTQDWSCIIIDEGHRMKNSKSVLHETMAKMRCKTRLLLTGTPLQNNVSELWALLHYLLPELFSSALDFEAWFRDPFRGVNDDFNQFSVEIRPEDEELVISRLHVMLAPFLLQRTKAQVLNEKLPPRVESIVRVELSPWQTSAYKDLEARTISMLNEASDQVHSHRVNNVLMQLRKIVLHPYLFGTVKPGYELLQASGKVEVLDRMLPKLLRFGHKTLIFSQFTSALDVLAVYLEWRGIACARLDGRTPHEQRREEIKRFSAPETGSPNVFLLSARAAGLGLNLQAADTVILFDLDWNPQNDKQAVARAHRVGQTREVRVFRLISQSRVERHMEARCREKLELEKKIIGAGMFTSSVSTEQRKDMLRSILGLDGTDTVGNAGATADCDADPSTSTSVGQALPTTSPEELNKLLARTAEELEAFAAMDVETLQHSGQGSPASDDPSLSFLVRCGRLMNPTDVPKGFSLQDEEGEGEVEL
eukprot:gnl/TRDRNA2_/TRDRNA2_84119_c0_seq1.p1 gnl/TRDRNA2_/TRDRNA2_84119_c0~~gnl/TRDRNA2_/TRDRNA2_84119_c0_seq1.p1  ORF type:complete len:863 (+),score=191.64 gnl/TRDRNA2_/TRDRNA2_84119_c0_seq1:55-2643(+)